MMQISIILPHQIFLEQDNVKRVVVETVNGSFGFLPRRLDCVTFLAPGILIYEIDQNEENYVAISSGVLTKVGQNVKVAVHNAISGTDLKSMRQTVEMELMDQDEQNRDIRTALTMLERNFVRSYLELKKYG